MDTLPQYLQHAASKYGNTRVAMRKKQLGIWREFSWTEHLLQIGRPFALIVEEPLAPSRLIAARPAFVDAQREGIRLFAVRKHERIPADKGRERPLPNIP